MSAKIMVGLTGGIGSGKSSVAQLLSVLGYPVYDSDRRAKALMHQDEALKVALVERFGTEVYLDGQLNRSYLAQIVFHNAQALAQLNAIVHPAVRADIKRWADAQCCDIVFVETAILWEAKLDQQVDKIWYVRAPIQERLLRVLKRDQATVEQVKARMEMQVSEEQNISDKLLFIDNADHDALLPQVKNALEELSAFLKNTF